KAPFLHSSAALWPGLSLLFAPALVPRPPRPGRTSAPSLPTPLAARHLKPPLLLLDPPLLLPGPKRHLPYNAQTSEEAPPLLLTERARPKENRSPPHAASDVTCLLAEDGAPLTDPVEMCGRARDFYTSLFSPDPTDPGACRVLWEELPTVSVGDRDRLELPLTLAEFSEALRCMPTNKSTGMDGLTVDFYRAFWDILCPDLAIVWAESLQGGVLPLSCRRAVLALLQKKGDLRDLQNWRPISLLSTDYKIVAKATSLRLGSMMADVIHPDQTYIVPGRSIFDNIFLVRDLLELGHRDGLSFAVLSLDQEKAFDRVDHGYLLGTLQAFGFGPQFVSFLQVLYASAECLVRLNWTLTEPVSFGRGSTAGVPPLGLTGLVLRESELRLVLSAYADDVLLVVQDPGDLARVEACQAISLAAFSTRVNWVKSSGLAVGDWWQALQRS
ncbi:unnamed protein product, partial [Caretta caretta]